MEYNNLFVNAHASWNSFLSRKDIQKELVKIDSFLNGKDYNPDNHNILRFLNNDLDQAKIIIIGQDTYPARGVATGRAFEVGGLYSWTDPFRQISLKNILRNIYGSYVTGDNYTKFKEIQSKISDGTFKILPPNLLFESWTKQGVILLNGALTCEVNKPGSHSEIWRYFVNEVIKYICEKNPQIIFFLWGSYAISFTDCISNKIYASRHPMMCSAKYSDDFLKNSCFEETKNIVNWLGKEEQEN